MQKIQDEQRGAGSKDLGNTELVVLEGRGLGELLFGSVLYLHAGIKNAINAINFGAEKTSFPMPGFEPTTSR